MPFFLVQLSYTAESWNHLVKDPQNRMVAVSPVVESLGGKIEWAFLSFGDYDAVGVLNFPDDITAAALSMAMMAGGGIRSIKTTPLISWEEGVDAMKKAKKAAYKPPEENPMLERK
ncbi:MAG TPA: GYD domain-containing protein [Candidatus Bathyarchaeia archaeon]